MIVSWQKPEQLFAEVRARKIKEVAEFHNRAPTDKAKEIIKLLRDMKGGKKKNTDDDKLVVL